MEFNTTTTSPKVAATDFQTLGGLAHSLQTIAIATIVFAVCVSLPKLKHQAQLSRLPTLGGSGSAEEKRKGFLQSARDLYSSGYKKVRSPAHGGYTADMR